MWKHVASVRVIGEAGTVASLKSALFRLSPVARRILPRLVQRFLLLKVLRTNDAYLDLRQRPSRRCLEREILPWIARHCRRVLFVGTGSYTFHYERQFRPGQYTTIEKQPRNAAWGARDHIVAPVEEIGRHRPDGAFDCVILNGVFGYGVDTAAHQRRVIEALHRALQPGGLLMVGWNTDRHDDPVAAGLFEPCFERCREPPFDERRQFAGETHTYDFFRRAAQ